jgi:F-type H+-transporting ATPase subunit epsilon
MLRPGILRILGAGERRIMVLGGFAEVSPEGLTILADTAVPVEEVDAAVIASEIKDTEEDVADTTDEATRDRLRTKLEQLRAVQELI